MSKHFFISDLDGTLLNEKGFLSEVTREKLIRLLDKGLIFSIATARGQHSVRELFQGIPIALPIVELNGAMVTDLRTGEHHVMHAMKNEIVTKILSFSLSEGGYPAVLTSDGLRDRLFYLPSPLMETRDYISDLKLVAGEIISDFRSPEKILEDNVLCINFYDNYNTLIAWKNKFKQFFPGQIAVNLYDDYLNPSRGWLSIYDTGATKDQGIRALVKHTELSHLPVTVFGDQSNDIPMFKGFSKHIAVGNAISELKSLASEIIGHHQDDAVIKYIEENH